MSRCHEAEEEAQDGLTPLQYSIDIIICETMIDLFKVGSKWLTSPLPKLKRDDSDYPRDRAIATHLLRRTPYLFFKT